MPSMFKENNPRRLCFICSTHAWHDTQGVYRYPDGPGEIILYLEQIIKC